MRITLDIDDDVLLAARQMARHQTRNIGRVISELARSALAAEAEAVPSQCKESLHPGLAKLGIQPLPARGGTVSNDLINRLRDRGTN